MNGLPNNAEDAARLAMGSEEHDDPLPPGPNYGPFGYFRLALLILAAVVAVLTLINLV
ncbi:hypothetical protein [Chelativorans sp. M5D2P16]|uniref:hypothetical protein n=1 Tax=Chelativorans sp. M5D2P16 TaxID=3095678 RepID=UPI002ACABA4B|nr:hypothetical protein [Chelativorans sp. M5D2P16]MDZ5699147.1 hypothetical protein [Chelativorans sp. M5D2P16]